VHKLNDWIAYPEILHRLREWGHFDILDALDERKLTIEEVATLAELIMGSSPSDITSVLLLLCFPSHFRYVIFSFALLSLFVQVMYLYTFIFVFVLFVLIVFNILINCRII